MIFNRLSDYTRPAQREERGEEGEDPGRIQHWLHWTQRCIAEHPKASIGVGVALGIALGWLIKRR